MTDSALLRYASNIAGSLKDLVKVMETLNTNFVAYAKQVKERDEAMSSAHVLSEGQIDLMRNYIAQPEGYAGGVNFSDYPFKPEAKDEKKEGE